MKTAHVMSELCHKTMNDTRPKWQNPNTTPSGVPNKEHTKNKTGIWQHKSMTNMRPTQDNKQDKNQNTNRGGQKTKRGGREGSQQDSPEIIFSFSHGVCIFVLRACIKMYVFSYVCNGFQRVDAVQVTLTPLISETPPMLEIEGSRFARSKASRDPLHANANTNCGFCW